MRRLGTFAAAGLCATLTTSAVAACSSGSGSPSAAHLPAASQVAPSSTSAPPATPTPVPVDAGTSAAALPRSSAVAVNPCASNSKAQQVRVSIRQQHLWMCAHHSVVRDTAVTTGIPGEDTHTPTGTFTIQARTRDTTLTLISGRTYDVKYWIPFDAPLFGFHDSSWQRFPYGSRRYRTDGSHGCVHMPLTAIAFLYHWARVGTSVRIQA